MLACGQMIAFSTARRLAVLSVLIAINAAPLTAQSLDTQPITFEAAPEIPGGAELQSTIAPELVVGYAPASRAPRLIRFSRLGRSREAMPQRAGFAVPSIIIGRVPAGREAEFGIGVLMPETIAQYSFAYDDLTAREALREADPEMFRKLVSQGYVDPPETEIASALQGELQRMKCYSARIDGAWGAGSQRAAAAYFATRGISAQGLGAQASPPLFRAVVLGGDVTCAVAVRAQPRAQSRASAPSGSRGTASTARAATPRAAAPAAPPASGPTISGGGIGFMR